ncbi:MAG: hypothetical protein AAF518_02190 [Spirochaetota bacterium]
MNRLKIIVSLTVFLVISFLANCNQLTGEKDNDDTNRNLLILGAISNSNSSSSSDSCTSGMIICIPKGLAE